MLNDENGAPLIALNPDSPFIPASIIKVLTALIALDILGPDFRFKTECYTNSKNDLIIKGYGDPFLVSDEIRLLAEELKKKGLKYINRLILDNSYFTYDINIPGISSSSNPYDALNGAIVVNFNTINIKKDADGKIASAEDETPLTPLAIKKASNLSPSTTQRINLSVQRTECIGYAAELFRAIFREKGLSVADTAFVEASVGGNVTPFITYYNSRSLKEILQGLLKYSNNFIANQIFLVIGAHRKGPPAILEKSAETFDSYIRDNLKIPPSELVMVEGSGISRNNIVSGRVMAAIMERFKPHAHLLTANKNGHLIKSGTLNGVYNYAGYIKTPRGLRSFVIILNQQQNNRDSILRILERY